MNPIVGIVWISVFDSFCRRYNIVVFPALSRPRIRIRTSFVPKREPNSFDMKRPWDLRRGEGARRARQRKKSVCHERC